MFQRRLPLRAILSAGAEIPATGTIRLASRGLARTGGIEALLGVRCRYRAWPSTEDRAVAGWGRKRSGDRARHWAEQTGLPCLLLEDGFLRSVGREEPPLSIVVDDLGIHYDATRPSRLEALIAAGTTPAILARGRALVEAWRAGRVSKYNGLREHEGALPGRYVLVADQARGDCSVAFGGAGDAAFAAMLRAALEENPGCTVLVKRHPDSRLRGSAGYFGGLERGGEARIEVLDAACHPARLVENCEAVYAATSQLGFEGLLWGKRVRCFGMPFYAGWGLTEDAQPAPARRGAALLEALVHAALAAYPRYRDPETGEACEVERVLEHLALQRRMRGRFPARVHAVGFSRWKRPVLRRFLAGSTVSFGSAARAPAGAALAAWGMRHAGDAPAVIRVEDGFLRSVGLGAALVEPLSWVQDDQGLYYDPSAPSRLETLLASHAFEPDLVRRAAALRRRIVAGQITKYNVGARPWSRPVGAGRVVLAVGQVEGDASLLCGAPGIRTNAELLRAVRALCPGAHLVYKPHPDVVAGLREGRMAEDRSLCDEVAADASVGSLLAGVDEVHTLTSLLGFEALMRGLPVTCHGQPFYAGWGLTTDRAPLPRRTRRLMLDELVAAALILYPAYVSRTTGQFTTPERAVTELEAARAAPPRGLGLALRRAAARMAIRPARQVRTMLETLAHG